MHGSNLELVWIFFIYISAFVASQLNNDVSGNGCASGSIGSQSNISLCPGEWTGHVSNASHLCAAGWRVCSSRDRDLLRTIRWEDAINVSGCYAIGASHYSGQCEPCDSSAQQTEMVGVGNACPYHRRWEDSCISGGTILSSRNDNTPQAACSYTPLMSGVLCCRVSGEPPKILVSPQALTHVQSGVTFVLSCQAMGDPTPTVKWFKDGRSLPQNISRIREFESGYLLLSEATPEDTGNYECVVTNTAGVATSTAKVLVTDHASGCADGTSDGLEQYENIHACKGTWEGHVKRGRSLCAKGWHVCSPRHESYLKMLTVADIKETPGCYAYNGMNSLNGCLRCHREDMAGIGSTCGRWRKSHNSCLALGRMDVLKGNTKNGCQFEAGITTGVLCCKRPKKNKTFVTDWEHFVSCTPRCDNGGICVGTNQCQCRHGYKGAWCQHPICTGGCIPNSYCIKPGVCRCRSGYTFNGEKCTKRRAVCNHPCFHGGVCKHGHCKCSQYYYGKMCQYGRTRAILIDQDTGQVGLSGGLNMDSQELEELKRQFGGDNDQGDWPSDWNYLKDENEKI